MIVARRLCLNRWHFQRLPGAGPLENEKVCRDISHTASRHPRVLTTTVGLLREGDPTAVPTVLRPRLPSGRFFQAILAKIGCRILRYPGMLPRGIPSCSQRREARALARQRSGRPSRLVHIRKSWGVNLHQIYAPEKPNDSRGSGSVQES